MAGFGKVTFIGEYFNQKIVNVMHYRSADWLPLAGNPFDDVLAFVDSAIVDIKPALLLCLPSDYTLQTVEGVGYDDAYNIVTASPLVRTVGEQGVLTGAQTMGAASTAIISLRCGPQFPINPGGVSKRNRGYLAIGPMLETNVDNYSHILDIEMTRLTNLAQKVAETRTVVLPPTTFIPIRIHEKYTNILGVHHLDWRTYSDVLGYRVNRVASYRKSRQPEA